MDGTPKPGETTPQTPPKNDAQPQATPVVNASDTAELERLRKENEQRDLRIRQLENEKAAKEKAEQEAEAKRLEEQNQFKTLYEQEKAKREQIEAERVANERKAELRAESDKLLAQYPDQVRELAAEAGLSLSDTDEASVAAFKSKLDKFSTFVKQPKPTPNNPGTPHETGGTDGMDAEQMRSMLNNPKAFEEYLKKNTKGIAGMMRQGE